MNILMVGTDDTVFKENQSIGNTIIRHSIYLKTLRTIEPESTITSFVFTRYKYAPYSHQDGLRYYPIKTPRVQFFPICGVFKALRIRKHLKVNVITSQNPFEAGLLGIALKWLFKAPLEIQVHLNFFSPYWLFEHRIVNQIRLWLARYVLTRANIIRAVSSTIRCNLVDKWGIHNDRISLIPIPAIYDPNRQIGCLFEKDIDQQFNIILFVGRLCYPKNLPGLFEIIQNVQESSPQSVFIIIGNGPLREYAEYNAQLLGSNSIKFLGNLEHEQVKFWYHRASVLVLPSLYEGFGRVLVESYISETPAVATKCGGPEDIIINGETGFLTAVEDLEEFSQRVLWLLEHPLEAKQMGKRGREYVMKEFDPKVLTSRMVTQWQNLAISNKNLV